MRVAEIYESIQGEGPHVGIPTTFVRFGGCNLRCPGWPCDTQFAIDPQYKDQWSKIDAVDIVGPIDTENVTLTGGEPFIQRSSELVDLHSLLFEEGHTIDIFTNGSQEFPEWVNRKNVTLIVDYKLPGSGEYGAFNDDNRNILRQTIVNMRSGQRQHAMKFVCKDEGDFETALEDIDMFSFEEYLQIFFGVVWGGEFTAAELSDMIMKHAPYGRLNIQTHNLVWPAHERRR